MSPIAFTPYASNEGYDEPAHTRSLAFAFTVRAHIDGLQMKAQAKVSGSSPTRWLYMHI